MFHFFTAVHGGFSGSRFLLAIFMLWGGMADVIFAQIPVFQDTFENGVVANSDFTTKAWMITVPTSASITESGGKLNVVAGGPSSTGGVISPLLYSGSPCDAYNFFKRKLRFTANIAITGTVANQSYLRCALVGTSGSNYSVDDALVLLFKADNTVTLSVKQDRPNTSTESVNALVNGVNMGSTITGFDLTLDSQNYTLNVIFQGGTGSATYTGKHGLVAAQWGIDGKSTVQFETVRASGGTSGAGQVVNASVDNFMITNMGTLAVFEDTFGNGILANSDLETNIWTSIVPYTSSHSKATGSLVQTASAADTSFVVSNLSTPVQSRFNFFTQQLKFSASVAVTGSASATWMKRGRMALNSQAGNSGNANDSLIVGFRAQNNITLVAKTDASYVEPDNVTSSANTFLLGGSEAVGIYSGSEMFNRFALTVNDKRFRLIGYNPGKGSGIVRFSGSHKISRSRWGANGDSAMALEAIRTSAEAGTATITTWDDLRVEADSTKLLDEPFWNFTATYSTSTTTTESGPFCLWLPATEPVIRGIIFISPGDGDDCRYIANDPAAQEAARSMGFGLIGYYNTARMNLIGNNTPYIKQAVQAVLDRAAVVSGHPEISNAPLCITGLSRGAFDSCYLARNWPERVIAFVPHCGGEWSAPVLTDAAKKVPGLFMPGSMDGNGATDPYVMKQYFTWWRSQGAQVAYAVDWGVGHTMRGNQGFEATWVWMAEVAKLRYPRPMVPSATAGVLPTLLNLNDASGWLGDNDSFSASAHTTPTLTHAFTTVTKSANYTGVATTASWLPNETIARVYRATTSTDYATYHTAIPLYSPLRIVAPAQFTDPVIAGNSVTIEVDPREFDNTNVLTAMDFYDGDVWLGAVTSGPAWQWTFYPAAGLHAISVVATDALGNKRDAFRVISVMPADFPPLAIRQSVPATANVTVSGTVEGVDPEGNAVTFALAQQPAHGTVILNASTGSYTYQSNPGYGGADAFTFTANDGAVTSNPATVDINVTVAPVGNIAAAAATPGSNAGEIALSWSAANNVASYYIERSTVSNSGFIQVATITAPQVIYTDTGRTAGQPYFYRIRPINTISNGNYSAVVSSLPHVPATVAGWRYLNFGTTNIVIGISGDLDIPNADGVTNLMKCALGLNLYNAQGIPVLATPTSMPYVQPKAWNGADYLTCSFTHNKNATDIVIKIEVANDPRGPWIALDPFLPENQVSVSDNTPSMGVETVVVKDTQPITATDRRFMRFRVTHP